MKLLVFFLSTLLAISVVPASSTREIISSKQQQLLRNLRLGDFDEFNELFDDATISIPDTFEVSQRVLLSDLVVKIWNVKCYGINIGDMRISHQLKNAQSMEVLINIFQLDLDCELNYEYNWGPVNGDGWLKITTDDNSASTKINFQSDDFGTLPPKGSSVVSCDANIEITRLDFEQDLLSQIVEVFQGLVRGVVERAIGNVACDELGSLGTTLVENMINLAEEKLDPYKGELTDAETDPLYLERNIELPNDLKALDFLNTDSKMGKLLDQALETAEKLLGTVVYDSTSSSNEEGLLINMFLRSFFLEEDGAFSLDPSEMLVDDVIFEGHDKITQTSITLNSVKIFGLDSMTSFDSFQKIGSFTLENDIVWSRIKVEFDLTINIKPSTLDDAILEDPTSPGITERITADFGLDNVEVMASLLLLLNEEGMEKMQLGPLLHTKHFLPCLLSSVHRVEVSGLSFNPATINEPTLNGFISAGVDRVISDSVEAAFAMYTGALRSSLPFIFQTSVRSFLNSDIIGKYMANATNTACHSVDPIPGYIEFPKFFDGEEPSHGDLPPLLKNLLNTELLSIDESTGRPKINDVLIKPFTTAQSGIEGNLDIAANVFGLHSGSVQRVGLDSIQLRAYNPGIRNLDNVGAPLELMKPANQKPQLLENLITLGESPDSVQFVMKALFALSGDPTLEMYNEMELSVDVASATVFAALSALIDSNALLSFPIADVTDLNCWLSILATPEVDESGQLGSNTELGFSLESLLLTTESMRFNVSCTNCTSPSLSILPTLFEDLANEGISAILERRLIDLALEIARSNFVQANINKRLIDGSLRCPHSPRFVDTLASSSYEVPSFPSLPHESLETIAFASSILVQIAAVIAAESHVGYDLEVTNPLDGQNEFGERPELRLIDFTSFETTVGSWANDVVGDMIEYVREIVEDSAVPTGKDLRINTILRSTFLDENGFLDINFNDIGIGSDDMQISLKHARISGLDSVSNLNVLDAIGPQTMQNVWKWKKLGVEVVFSLMSTELREGRSLKSMQDITLSIDFGDIDISLAAFLALDRDLLGGLKLHNLLEIKNILPCILTAAHSAKITELQVLVGSMKNFGISGFESDDLKSAATESSRFLLERYGEKITAAVPGIFDLTIRTILNNMIAYYMDDGSTISCPTSPTSIWSAFVDLRDLFLEPERAQTFGGSGLSQYGNLFRTALGFVKDLAFKIDPSSGLSAINNLAVSPLTVTQSNSSGSLIFSGDILKGGSRVAVGGLDANIEIRASNARIDNLNTIGAPMHLLETVLGEPFHLNNTLTFGVADKPVRIAFNFFLSLMDDDDMQVRNDVEISLDLYNANVIFKTLTKILESRFFEFPLQDLFDVNCWMALMPAPSLDEYGVRLDSEIPPLSLQHLVASVSGLNLNVSCVDCTSPRMPELTDLLSKAEAQEEMTVALNKLLDYVTELVGGNFLQVQFDRALNDAARKCPHSPSFDPEAKAVVYEPFQPPTNETSMSFLVMLTALAVVFAFAIVAVIFLTRWVVRRRHKKWLGRLPPHQVRLLAREQHRQEKEEAEVNAATKSMFTSTSIPLFARWGMPLVIIGNIVFFLSGHLSLGATVNIEATLAGESFRVDKFFEFSMARSTVDIWNAGGKELAIIILVFSGIWPYTKQLITLALWFLPPSRLSVSKRESILLWLDRLGKWSMIDIFVLVISIAAFRVSVASPEVLFLPTDFYSIDLLVVPLWGLYANMIAQVISQISSHFIIHYHRRIVSEAKSIRAFQRQDQIRLSPNSPVLRKGDVPRVEISTGANDTFRNELAQRSSLHRHQFGRPHRGEAEKLIVRTWVNKLLLFFSVTLAILVVVSASIPSFSLEILGIIGVAVESGQNFKDARTAHSVFTVIKLLFEEADFLGTVGDYIGLGTLSILFAFTVLLVPIIQSIALLRQWFSSATREEMKRMSVVLEILQAWQYAEVYLIAIFVASWQLGPVSEFMINSYCDSLKETFGQMVYYGLLKEEDAQCFSVKSSIESGSYLLALGALLLAFISTFVSKAAVQYMRDQGETEKRLRDEEDSLNGSDFTSPADDDSMVDFATSSRIRPVPVLFTDTFRWFLYQENNHWGLPDTHYHWSSPSGSPSRAMFLPEAQVLSQEPMHAVSPDQYPKMKYAEAKIESDMESISRETVSSRSSFNSFRSKSQFMAGLKTTGLDDEKEPLQQNCAPSRASFKSSNSIAESAFKDESSISPPSRASTKRSNSITESVFKDESSVSGSSKSPSAQEALSRSGNSVPGYESTDDDEYEYEEVVSNDYASEYDEQTVNTGFEEFTVMTEDIIEEELDDVISSYESQSVRFLD